MVKTFRWTDRERLPAMTQYQPSDHAEREQIQKALGYNRSIAAVAISGIEISARLLTT
ncbi:hypothetical protein HCH52_08785 [Oscillospiraceae bacterium HV4-5-C5C]|nr:hypothetical protein [Oscillospiraceae bacterium HV4-5-C5C]